MKKIILGIVILSILLATSGCYTHRTFKKEFNTTYNLIRLEETPFSQGRLASGFLVGSFGGWESGNGLMIAIESKEYIILIQDTLNKFVIKYEEGVSYVKLKIEPHVIDDLDIKSLSDAEKIKLFTNQYEIHIPKGSENDFIAKW